MNVKISPICHNLLFYCHQTLWFVSALHIASGGQHVDCVRLLLSHGAPCTPDSTGTTPQQLARKPEVVEAFHLHDGTWYVLTATVDIETWHCHDISSTWCYTSYLTSAARKKTWSGLGISSPWWYITSPIMKIMERSIYIIINHNCNEILCFACPEKTTVLSLMDVDETSYLACWHWPHSSSS